MVILRKDQLVSTGSHEWICGVYSEEKFCLHCGRRAEHKYKFFDRYDREDWYECDCDVAKTIDNLYTEKKNLEDEISKINGQLSYYLSQEADTIRRARIEKSVKDIVEKEGITLSYLQDVFKPKEDSVGE